MIIRAPHPTIDQPNTYLTAAVAAAATALTVANNAEFSNNDYFVLGRPGQEGAELHKISTVSGNVTINCSGSAVKFAAAINTPLAYIKYNQVKFYLGDWSGRYVTGKISVTRDSATITGIGTSWGAIDNTYALLLNGRWYDVKSADSATQITLTENYQGETDSSATYALVPFSVQATVDIAADQLETLWDDIDALAEDYYRTGYYNSTTSVYSTLSSIISAAEPEGFSEFSLRAMEDEVLGELKDPEAARRSRQEIDRDLNSAQRSLLNTVISSVKEDYLNTRKNLDLTTNGEEPLFDDFRKMISVWISYDGVNYLKARKMDIGDDLPNAQYQQVDPRYYIRDNVVGIKPVPTAGITNGAQIWYERRMPSLVNEGDTIPHILRDFKRAYIDFALEKALMSDDKAKAAAYGNAFVRAKQEVSTVLKDRDSSTNQQIEAVNDGDLYVS